MKRIMSILVPAIALATTPAWAQQSSPDGGQTQPSQQQEQSAAQGQDGQQSAEQAGQPPQEQQPSEQAGQAPAGSDDPTATAPQGAIIVMQEEGQVRVESIIGTSVRSGPGEEAEKIGNVSDLLLDQDNNLVAALVGVGGFLGIGEKTVALSWDALSIQRDAGGDITITSEVTRAQLEDAPGFRTLQDQLAEQQQAEERQQMQQQQQQMQQSPVAQ